ncbi:MAG: hypothetical protein M3542_09515, partial [Acidobacteriota bacterium]|nr:hypothetical protein [Acidobacteriota bacterium]
MITILVVAEPEEAEALDRVAGQKPSLELLHAGDVEETLERLSRNRRIDAVLLLLPPDRAREVATVVREEDPSAPPLFAPATTGPVPDVRALGATTPEELLDALT